MREAVGAYYLERGKTTSVMPPVIYAIKSVGEYELLFSGGPSKLDPSEFVYDPRTRRIVGTFKGSMPGGAVGSPATAPARLQPTHQTAQLSEDEVIRISNRAAEREGLRLADYGAPEVHFEFTSPDKTWTVFYEDKIGRPGHHFLVVVDDATGKPQVMHGE